MASGMLTYYSLSEGTVQGNCPKRVTAPRFSANISGKESFTQFYITMY